MSLDFVKEALGDSYTEEIDKKIATAIGKNFVPKTDFNAKLEAIKGLEGQLEEANKTIEEFKGLDVEEIQRKADEYKEQAAKAKQEADEAVEALKFDFTLSEALREANCRDVVSVKAHLKTDALKLDDGKILGLKEQLETLKAEKDFLFEPESQDPEIRLNTGGDHGDPPATESSLQDEISSRLFGK